MTQPTAQQYSFALFNPRTKARDQVRATARTADGARAAVVAYYPTHEVSPEPVLVRPAHHSLGEIDCL